MWDVESCGQQMRVRDQGLTATLREEEDTYEEKLVWEFKEEWRWEPVPHDIQNELERRFLKVVVIPSGLSSATGFRRSVGSALMVGCCGVACRGSSSRTRTWSCGSRGTRGASS